MIPMMISVPSGVSQLFGSGPLWNFGPLSLFKVPSYLDALACPWPFPSNLPGNPTTAVVVGLLHGQVVSMQNLHGCPEYVTASGYGRQVPHWKSKCHGSTIQPLRAHGRAASAGFQRPGWHATPGLLARSYPCFIHVLPWPWKHPLRTEFLAIEFWDHPADLAHQHTIVEDQHARNGLRTYPTQYQSTYYVLCAVNCAPATDRPIARF